MRREFHVRICGRLGAKFPGPTRQQETEPCQTGMRRALRKQRLRMPPGAYRYCACSRLHSSISRAPAHPTPIMNGITEAGRLECGVYKACEPSKLTSRIFEQVV